MGEIIKLNQGEQEDGKLLMSFIGNKWRNAQYERMMAEKDTKRIEVRIKAKETL